MASGARFNLVGGQIVRLGASYRLAAANLFLSLLFFSYLWSNRSYFESQLASDVFLVGAVPMGIFSLLRTPPIETQPSLASIIAYLGMLALPLMMKFDAKAPAPLYSLGAALELLGVVLSQSARIWMGRAFGILPANRGIVTQGPFRWVRHPVYSGWLILTTGRVLLSFRLINVLLALATVPFVIWRIALEERLLQNDPAYQSYQAQVRFKLFPYLY